MLLLPFSFHFPRQLLYQRLHKPLSSSCLFSLISHNSRIWRCVDLVARSFFSSLSNFCTFGRCPLPRSRSRKLFLPRRFVALSVSRRCHRGPSFRTFLQLLALQLLWSQTQLSVLECHSTHVFAEIAKGIFGAHSYFRNVVIPKFDPMLAPNQPLIPFPDIFASSSLVIFPTIRCSFFAGRRPVLSMNVK